MKIIWTEAEDSELRLLWESDTPVAKLFMQSKTNRQMRGRANQLGLKRHTRCITNANIYKNKNIIGRDMSYENCKTIAAKYKTKSQFRIEDGSAYVTARVNGWLDDFCKDMLTGLKFNFPQTFLFALISILHPDAEVLYNDRKAIHPKEIDVYIPSLKIGFEYDGYNYHSDEESIVSDKYKNELCINAGITLHRILEKNKYKPTDYIVQQLTEIGYTITSEDITNANEYTRSKYINLEDISTMISKCEFREDFFKKYPRVHRFLKKSDMLHMLDHIPKRVQTFTDDEILSTIISCVLKSDMLIQHHGKYLQMMKNKAFYTKSYDAYRKLPSKHSLRTKKPLVNKSGRISQKLICPHCGIRGAGNVMYVHHFDKCKLKPK